MIALQDLAVGYRSRRGIRVVADAINGTICRGELTCLLGTNGVGKSTLLRTLSAFQPKLGGGIYINGKELDEYTGRQLARLIGVVLTERPEVHNLSVSDLIGLGRSPYTGFWGGLDEVDREVVQKAVALVGIEGLMGRMTDMLSDGERQKVMIAKALAQETPIILLDEPTAFLDFPSKVEIMQLLHRLSRQMQKTVFLSTHDLDLALQLADKVWLMGEGGSLAVGTPEDLALDGVLAKFFLRKGICLRKLIRITVRNAYISCPAFFHSIIKPFAMVKKALRRNGIEAGDEVQSDTCIEVDEEHYLLNRPGQPLQTASTVEELLQLLAISSS